MLGYLTRGHDVHIHIRRTLSTHVCPMPQLILTHWRIQNTRWWWWQRWWCTTRLRSCRHRRRFRRYKGPWCREVSHWRRVSAVAGEARRRGRKFLDQPISTVRHADRGTSGTCVRATIRKVDSGIYWRVTSGWESCSWEGLAVRKKWSILIERSSTFIICTPGAVWPRPPTHPASSAMSTLVTRWM